MKKIRLTSLVIVFVMFWMTGMVNATLITIGTADYDSNGSGVIDTNESYNLIWDNDNNGNSVVWLDYSNARANKSAQTTWVSGLDSTLTINLDAEYKITWNDQAWRLPTTVDGRFLWPVRYDGTTAGGYNVVTSEMGHLYYEELGNLGYSDTSGVSPQSGYGLQNTGDFKNLVSGPYWSGTEYTDGSDQAWYFYMNSGLQYYNLQSCTLWGVAVRSGQVSIAPVPEPATTLLFGLGLLGLAGMSRRKLS